MQVLVAETLTKPDRYQPLAMQSWLAGIEEYRFREESGEGLAAFQEQLVKEARAGAYVDVKFTLVVARQMGAQYL